MEIWTVSFVICVYKFRLCLGLIFAESGNKQNTDKCAGLLVSYYTPDHYNHCATFIRSIDETVGHWIGGRVTNRLKRYLKGRVKQNSLRSVTT